MIFKLCQKQPNALNVLFSGFNIRDVAISRICQKYLYLSQYMNFVFNVLNFNVFFVFVFKKRLLYCLIYDQLRRLVFEVSMYFMKD